MFLDVIRGKNLPVLSFCIGASGWISVATTAAGFVGFQALFTGSFIAAIISNLWLNLSNKRPSWTGSLGCICRDLRGWVGLLVCRHGVFWQWNCKLSRGWWSVSYSIEEGKACRIVHLLLPFIHLPYLSTCIMPTQRVNRTGRGGGRWYSSLTKNYAAETLLVHNNGTLEGKAGLKSFAW